MDEARAESLWRNRSFWGLTVTQFLGAFNDNLYKQLLLLLFVAVPIAGQFDEAGQPITADRQGWAQFFFAMPFVMFSGYAGYLSDKYSKRRVIVLCKLAEIGVMLLGVVVFRLHGSQGMTGLVFWLLCGGIGLMGTHSAFFGPGKYGSMPEFLPDRHLPTANGVVLMTTFLAIIFGSAVAGILAEEFAGRLWMPGLICILIAVAGTASACWIRPLPPSSPNLKFDIRMLGIPRDISQLLRVDRPLRAALAVSTVFWLTAAIVQLTVIALGERQLQVGERKTSLLVAIISLGIALGSSLAGFMSRGRSAVIVQRVGALGLCLTLVLLCLPGGPNRHLLGYAGSFATLLVMGGFTGMFAVPLQVFLQARPPDGLKGRMIATQNLLNWIGICMSAGIYFAANKACDWLGWPVSAVFAVGALCMLPVVLIYRPVVAEDLATGNLSS